MTIEIKTRIKKARETENWNDYDWALSSLEIAHIALTKIAAYFDCISCENNSQFTCVEHLEYRMNKAKEALEKIRASSMTQEEFEHELKKSEKCL